MINPNSKAEREWVEQIIRMACAIKQAENMRRFEMREEIQKAIDNIDAMDALLQAVECSIVAYDNEIKKVPNNEMIEDADVIDELESDIHYYRASQFNLLKRRLKEFDEREAEK